MLRGIKGKSTGQRLSAIGHGACVTRVLLAVGNTSPARLADVRLRKGVRLLVDDEWSTRRGVPHKGIIGSASHPSHHCIVLYCIVGIFKEKINQND